MKHGITIAFCILGLTAIGQIPSAGLVSHYPFTTNADDQSGNNFDGTVDGATLTEDRFSHPDRAYDFNGTTDNITIPHDPALKPDFPFTISLWFKIDAFGGTAPLLYASDEATNSYSGFWVGYVPSGSMSVGYGNAQGLGGGNRITKHSNTIIDTTAWHNVIAVFNALDDIDLYIDCVLDPGSYSGSSTAMVSGSNNSVIGRSLGHSPNAYHNGKIDDIRLYDQAISAKGVGALCAEDPYVSVEEINSENINIYPNPAAEIVHVDLNKTAVTRGSVKIHDLAGRLIFTDDFQSSTLDIDISAWDRTSIYFLTVLDQSGNVITSEKLVLK